MRLDGLGSPSYGSGGLQPPNDDRRLEAAATLDFVRETAHSTIKVAGPDSKGPVRRTGPTSHVRSQSSAVRSQMGGTLYRPCAGAVDRRVAGFVVVCRAQNDPACRSVRRAGAADHVGADRSLPAG